MAPLQRSCLPIVDQGCCCDLKTCCKVQGWLTVVGSLFVIVSSVSDLAAVRAVCQNAETKVALCPNDDVIAAEHAIQAINLIMHVFFLVAAILFLVGISKGEPSKMVHYIRLAWVEIFCCSILYIAGAALVTPLFLIGFVFLGITVYSLICANSLHILMMAGQEYVHSTV